MKKSMSFMTGDELREQLCQEVVYYDEDLYSLCRIIQKCVPRKYLLRIISKMYRLRVLNTKRE